MHLLTWSVIVNRVTCRRAWRKWESYLEANQVPHTVHHTHSLEALHKVLEKLLSDGQRKILFAGGDGTLHQGVNAILRIRGENASDITIGLLPCGTGNDWFRSFGVSKHDLAKSLHAGTTAPMPVIRITWPDGRIHYGVNMVGAALDASVVHLLRRTWIKLPSYIIYPYGLIRALLRPHTWKAKITIDGKIMEGTWLTIQAGIGKYCGGKMHVLPHATADQPGYLLMKPKSLPQILLSTPSIYNGRIIEDPRAVHGHFRVMEIESVGKEVPVEADGEFLGWGYVRVEVLDRVMNKLKSEETALN